MANEIEDSIEKITRKVHAEHKAKIKALKSNWKQIVKEHDRQIAAWWKRAKLVWHDIAKDLNAKAPDPDEIDWPQNLPTATKMTIRCSISTRDYVEQMDRYKAFQDKPTERRNRNGGSRS